MTTEAVILLFFQKLEEQGIIYAILHSYEELPQSVSSDVDFAVDRNSFKRVSKVIRDVCKVAGWLHIQELQHETTAVYSVICSSKFPHEFLKLDYCSDYRRNGALLARSELLLKNRRKHNGLFIPSIAAEFRYILSKFFAKEKPLEDVIDRLEYLRSSAPERCDEMLGEITGDESCALESVQLSPAEYRRRMLRTHKEGLIQQLREFLRKAARCLWPTGLVIAIYGPDGTGKSTLIDRLLTDLEPAFRRTLCVHFRPKFGRSRPGSRVAVTNPHELPPRGTLMSFLKICFYFLDHLVSHFMVVLPAKCRSTLIIFDRSFHDLLIDPVRYRINTPRWLIGLFAKLLPKPDLTIALSAPAEVIHQRKAELPLDEIEAQLKRMYSLGQQSKLWEVVKADACPEKVASQASIKILNVMAERICSAIRLDRRS